MARADESETTEKFSYLFVVVFFKKKWILIILRMKKLKIFLKES